MQSTSLPSVDSLLAGVSSTDAQLLVQYDHVWEGVSGTGVSRSNSSYTQSLLRRLVTVKYGVSLGSSALPCLEVLSALKLVWCSPAALKWVTILLECWLNSKLGGSARLSSFKKAR